MDKVYSYNGEVYLYDSIDELLDSEYGIETGDIVTIYEAVPIYHKAQDYFRVDVIGDMQDSAYEETCGFADSWLESVTKEQVQELEDHIKKVISEWADKHKLHPNFFTITGDRTIKIKKINDNNDYEVIEEDGKYAKN